jgi:hypothetical protein
VAEPDFLLKRGDTSSSIFSTLENSGGTAVDLTGATVLWKLQPLAGGTLTVAGTATILQSGSTAVGQVQYAWATAIGTAGRYLGEWEVTYSGGAVQSFPNDGYVVVDVVSDLR